MQKIQKVEDMDEEMKMNFEKMALMKPRLNENIKDAAVDSGERVRDAFKSQLNEIELLRKQLDDRIVNDKAEWEILTEDMKNQLNSIQHLTINDLAGSAMRKIQKSTDVENVTEMNFEKMALMKQGLDENIKDDVGWGCSREEMKELVNSLTSMGHILMQDTHLQAEHVRNTEETDEHQEQSEKEVQLQENEEKYEDDEEEQ